jgi:integrase/recombinase XerD
MTFHLLHQAGANHHAQSPFRIIEQHTGREVAWINRFLDRECVRRLADTTLRSYALDLMHFVRWWASLYQTDAITEDALAGSTLLDYVRFQSGQKPRPAAATINRRIFVIERALQNEFPHAPSQFAPGFQKVYWKRSQLAVERPRPALSRLRVKTPRPMILPLSVDEVARFWRSFRTSRDFAIVGLMLLQGLRSQEVLALNLEDLLLAEAQIRVRGKGSKIRFLPLAPETIDLLDHYMRLERPDGCGPALFVSLKGPARGTRMTSAGLRSLFRHHRLTTGVTIANPHRFRHTFASDMLRAGVSLPALMRLLGHSQIQTTLGYIQLTPPDVYKQYARAVSQHIRPVSPRQP